jgi:hypothetical protein
MLDEDDIWFDSLAGGKGDQPEKAAAAARAVRAAILTHIAAEAPVLVGQDLKREAELIARARAEGLLPLNRGQSRRWPAFLAAAAIVGLAITVTLQMRTPTHIPVTRGSAYGIERIRDAHPRELQQSLLSELKAVGVQGKAYESFGRPGIDADLPTPLPQAVRDVLARHGISPPSDGVLQLEIDRAP